MKKNRILELQKLLKEKTDKEHPLKMSEILEELNTRGIKCCEKSIRSDIHILRKTLGLNIIHSNGRSAKIYLESSEILKQSKQILDAVATCKNISDKDKIKIKKSIENMIPEYYRDEYIETKATFLDKDNDLDGVIDRFDVDANDSKVSTYEQLEEREDSRTSVIGMLKENKEKINHQEHKELSKKDKKNTLEL